MSTHSADFRVGVGVLASDCRLERHKGLDLGDSDVWLR
jgi:hypothetical protein